MPVILFKPYLKSILITFAGITFTAVELLLTESGSLKLILAPLILIPASLSILYPTTFPLFFIASSFFFWDFGLTLPQWTYFNTSDYLFPLLILFTLGGKKLSLPKWGAATATENIARHSIPLMLGLFSLIAVFSQLTIIASLNESSLLRALIFSYHCIQLPITFLILTSYFRHHSTAIPAKAVLALMCFQIVLVFSQQLFKSNDAVAHGTYGHHAMIGNIMLISIAWCTAFLLTARNQVFKVLSGVLAFCSLLAIIFSQSRSALTGIVLALAIMLAASFKLTKKFILSSAITIFIVGLLYFLTPLNLIIYNTLHASPIGLDMSSYSRFFIWRGAWDFFIHSPWQIKLLGHGMGQYSLIPYHLWLEAGKYTSGAHNNFLQALIETGALGLIVFAGLFFVILKELWRQRKDNQFSRFFFYGTIALLGSGFTQETFWFQNSFGSFWLFYTCCLSIVLCRNNKATVAVS